MPLTEIEHTESIFGYETDEMKPREQKSVVKCRDGDLLRKEELTIAISNDSTALHPSSLPSLQQQIKQNQLKINNFSWTRQKSEDARQTNTLKYGKRGKSRESQARSAYLEQKRLDP